jgi:hypothetical protein
MSQLGTYACMEIGSSGLWDTAAEAALILHMNDATDVHDDYRPSSAEVEWARVRMDRWMVHARRPLEGDCF